MGGKCQWFTNLKNSGLAILILNTGVYLELYVIYLFKGKLDRLLREIDKCIITVGNFANLQQLINQQLK